MDTNWCRSVFNEIKINLVTFFDSFLISIFKLTSLWAVNGHARLDVEEGGKIMKLWAKPCYRKPYMWSAKSKAKKAKKKPPARGKSVFEV